jgi:hypothetical protein
VNKASLVRRLRRRWWPHRNPLARRSDRVEGASLVVTVLLGLLFLPVMLMFGSIVRADMVDKGERQATNANQVVATLTDDAPEPTADGHGNAIISSSHVTATWTTSDGVTHTGRVPATDGLKAGAKVRIWLNADDELVTRPLSATDAAAGGAFVALGGWLAVVTVLALAQLGLHFALDRRRYRQWDRQWARVEPGWNDYRRPSA